MSWLKFLSKTYQLKADLTDNDIEDILAAEDAARSLRDIYTKRVD